MTESSARKVPFLDVGQAYEELRSEIEEALLRVARSGHYILGPEVEAFERDFAAHVGVGHCVGMSNGLDALKIGLLALGVEPGDEVLVPSNTFIATWLAVSECGAVPVPVEPDPATHQIDSGRIEAALGPRTKAIVPVHLYGHPADMDAIMEVADRYGLKVIEDAAQAHGGFYKGRRIGADGHAAAWSFYPGKNLGALGDAGALTTGDPAVAERAALLRNYGSSTKYLHEAAGFNCRLDPLQAAVLAAKLPHLDDWVDRRRRVAAFYNDALADTGLGLPVPPQWADPSWHLYVVRSGDRARLREALDAAGIETLIHYPLPPHRQQAYAHLQLPPGAFPIAEKLAATCLSLPLWPGMTEAHVATVAAAIRRFAPAVHA
jgi:dTDP-4-amino-4,6-dideoxygalactose transaminase